MGRIPAFSGAKHVTVSPYCLTKKSPSSLVGDRVAPGLSDASSEKLEPRGVTRDDAFHRIPLAVDEHDTGTEHDAAFNPGDIVEVGGLSSEAGQLLNGSKGVVLKCYVSDGRAEVRLASGQKKLKFENLTKMDWAGGDQAQVEVFGLTSETGKAMNGLAGVITGTSPGGGRFEVKIDDDRKVSFKPDNLRLLVPR